RRPAGTPCVRLQQVVHRVVDFPGKGEREAEEVMDLGEPRIGRQQMFQARTRSDGFARGGLHENESSAAERAARIAARAAMEGVDRRELYSLNAETRQSEQTARTCSSAAASRAAGEISARLRTSDGRTMSTPGRRGRRPVCLDRTSLARCKA